jgi:hypothetical protein
MLCCSLLVSTSCAHACLLSCIYDTRIAAQTGRTLKIFPEISRSSTCALSSVSCLWRHFTRCENSIFTFRLRLWSCNNSLCVWHWFWYSQCLSVCNLILAHTWSMHLVLPLKLGVTLAWEEEGTLKRESHPFPIRLVFWGDWAFPRGGHQSCGSAIALALRACPSEERRGGPSNPKPPLAPNSREGRPDLRRAGPK